MTADNNPHLVLTRFLMARAHSAWLAATRLALSTQTVEAYPLLRAVIENAWYALHLAHDPAPPARAMTWLRRAESEDAKARREGVLGQECAPDASVLAGSSVDHPAVAWRIVARLGEITRPTPGSARAPADTLPSRAVLRRCPPPPGRIRR